MNEPIKVTITTDHLTIEFDQLRKLDAYLFDKFVDAIPKTTRSSTIEMHGKDYYFVYGTPEELYKFLYNVTSDFDLLLV